MTERKCPQTIYSKLRSLDLPSEAETAQIKNVVDDIKGDLARCEAEILSLTSVLAELNERKAHLQDIRNNYRALLAPVRRLPVETLLKIFTFACVKSPSLSIASVDCEDTLSMPTLHIARTCSQWRKITLSNPSLWSNITVDLAQRSWDVRGLVELYLQRSLPSLLTLTIKAVRLEYNTTDFSAYHLQELASESWDLFGLLLKETPRWSRVSFDLAMNICEHVDLWVYEINEEDVPLQYSLQNLRHLELTWNRWRDDEDDTPDFFSKFLSAPSLCELRMPVPDHLIPLNQLVKAVLEYPTLLQLYTFLRQCPRLKALSIFVPFQEPEVHNLPTRGIESDTLESISFTNLGEHSIILSLFALPRLKSLSVDFGKEMTGQDMLTEHLKMMLAKSPSLLKLAVHGHLGSGKSVIDILSSIPHLQNLEFFVTYNYYQTIKTDLFRAFTMTDSPFTPRLMPDLAHLGIHLVKECNCHWQEAEADSATVSSMLESRRTTLRHFEMRLESCTPSASQWFDSFSSAVSRRYRIAGLGADGLKLTLSSTKGD
ncbi:hypothetical protein VKT23_003544 [Stygiomarasmius scandens]|uniref:F-box domain-containing protein n=1 Tax=Marasmiellus scandens TaxID=2682957 RepID=A0ABR1JXJ3_9AGAR